MPLPTPAEIVAGFEKLVPTPAEAQKIQDVRTQLNNAAQFVVTQVNDNTQARLAIKRIQEAFSMAKSSILLPASP